MLPHVCPVSPLCNLQMQKCSMWTCDIWSLGLQTKSTIKPNVSVAGMKLSGDLLQPPWLYSSDLTWCFPCVLLSALDGDVVRRQRGEGLGRLCACVRASLCVRISVCVWGGGNYTLLPLGRLLSFTSNILRAYKRYLLNLHRKLRKHAVIMYVCGIQSISHSLGAPRSTEVSITWGPSHVWCLNTGL